MPEAEGMRLRLTKGDFGVPLPICLTPHCKVCGEELVDTDVVRLTVERGGIALVTQETTWGTIQAADGYCTFALTADEAQLLDWGLYTWRICLLRDGELRNTLVTDTLEVVL